MLIVKEVLTTNINDSLHLISSGIHCHEGMKEEVSNFPLNCNLLLTFYTKYDRAWDQTYNLPPLHSFRNLQIKPGLLFQILRGFGFVQLVFPNFNTVHCVHQTLQGRFGNRQLEGRTDNRTMCLPTNHMILGQGGIKIAVREQ